MVLLEQTAGPGPTPVLVETDEHAARRTLRAQIARLDRDLGTAVLAAYPRLPVSAPAITHAGPRVLSLGELEHARDELVERLAVIGAQTAAQAERQAEKRLLFERMLLDPARYKWVRIANEDIGQPGCKHWHVRPRLGLIGMLAGWWHVKISSGCPLAT
jgi:hypothetical protein